MKIILAITGASGVAIGVRLAEALKKQQLTLIVSEHAKKVIGHELGDAGKTISQLKRCGKVYGEEDIEAPPASGSSLYDAMVICPCSMKTLSAIANGFSCNLIARSADVMVTERRKLILVPRETPLSPIHLENMLKLSRLGVVILPPTLGFYHKPKNVDDMINFVVGKILDMLRVENRLYRRWGVA